MDKRWLKGRGYYQVSKVVLHADGGVVPQGQGFKSITVFQAC